MSESGEGSTFTPSQVSLPSIPPIEGSFNKTISDRFTAIADDFAQQDNPDIAVVSNTPQAPEQSPTEARFEAIASDFAKEATPDLPNVRFASVEPKQSSSEKFQNTPVIDYLTTELEKSVQKSQRLEQELRETTEKYNRKGTVGKIASFLGFNSKKAIKEVKIFMEQQRQTEFTHAISEINEGNTKKAEEVINHDANMRTIDITHTYDQDRGPLYEPAREVIAVLRILNPEKARKYELKIEQGYYH